MVIIGAMLAIIFDLESEIAVYSFIFLLACAILYRYGWENRGFVVKYYDVIQPMGMGVVVSFLGLLILPSIIEEMGMAFRWWITAVTLWPLLVATIYLIAKDVEQEPFKPPVIYLLGLVVLLMVPALRMPGLLGGLMVLLLSFWRWDRLMLGTAVVMLLYYISAYYYWLEWTLLMKSFVLFATGLLFLLGNYVVRKSASSVKRKSAKWIK